MPFTFSHPAAIIPFLGKNRKLFSATGLVIGSLAPDFESFILLNEKKVYGHTWLGVFWFDLPLTIILALLFHGIVRDPLIQNLPWRLHERLKRFEHNNWIGHFKKHFIVVIISMLIGIVSHLLFDALTHLNLYDPDATDSAIYLGHIQVYLLLQYTLSVIGLALVIFYIYKIPIVIEHRTIHHNMKFNINTIKHAPSGKLLYWVLLVICTSLIMTLAIYFLERDINIILFIDICIAGLCGALIVVPLLQKLIIPVRY